MKTLEELRKLDVSKLSEELIKLKRNHFKISFEVKNGHSKAIDKVKSSKKQIARVKTVMQEISLKNK